MKKIVSVKEIMIILVSLIIIIISTEVFAVQPDFVLGGGNNNTPQTVSPDEYAGALTPEVDKGNNAIGNNKIGNNTKGNNNTDLPQTGIEDYNIGILMVICIASAIFAYRKINDYKNI